jgi:hypothetical protein
MQHLLEILIDISLDDSTVPFAPRGEIKWLILKEILLKPNPEVQHSLFDCNQAKH